MARVVLSAQVAVDDVWPGFWPERQPFLVYEPEGDALLYSPAAPPSGYAPYRLTAAEAALHPWRQRLYWHEGTPDGLYGLYDAAYRTGDVTATAVVLQESIEATLQTLFHETFHVYQHRHFDGESAGLGFVAPAAITDSMTAKAEVERRILREALQSESPDRSRELARQYLAVRASRNRETPAKAREIERMVERDEGSAQLVGIQATMAALARGPDAVSARIERGLAVPLGELGGGLSERMFRWRLYGTGAAIGLLLERFGVEGWRERLEQDGAFEALLAEATGFEAAATTRSMAERALERFDYGSLLRQARAREVAAAAPSFDAGVRVVITFSGEPGNVRSSFKGSYTALDEQLVLIEADLYTAEITDFTLVAREVDVLLDNRDDTRLSFAVAALPAIEGLPRDAGTATLQRLTLQTDELTIRADRPVKVRSLAASIEIEVPARE